MAEISFDTVTKRFDDGTVAVDGVSMDIGDGEFMVLVGPSGSGKTTVMRMVAGLEAISGGAILIGGERVNDMPARERNIAMVFQNYALYPHMTVAGNIGFPLRLAKVPKAEIEKRVTHAAEMLGISDYLKRRPRALSGGQRQRVAMGRAIVRQPRAFLMDEPLSNLDAKLRIEMRSYIARLHQELKTTTIYVTHDQSEAMTMGDRVALMRDGQIEQLDSPSTLYDHPKNLFVAGFIGAPPMNIVRARIVRRDGGLAADAGAIMLPITDAVAAAHPALPAHESKTVLVGLRPEALADAAFESELDGHLRFQATVALAQSMGSEVIAHLQPTEGVLATAGVTEFTGEETTAGDRHLSSAGELVARFDTRTRAAAGALVTVSLDLARIHFFDPETEAAIQ